MTRQRRSHVQKAYTNYLLREGKEYAKMQEKEEDVERPWRILLVDDEPALVEDKIHIIVEDTGCGIPEKELPFIFQRFYVGENNKQNGTGLGLYIVHNIVIELCGTIHVDSIAGEGTKFVMEFPVTI